MTSMKNNLLGFNVNIGLTKPENIINRDADCPFCDRESLTDVIDCSGEMLLIQNKYKVLQDSEQTVLIESKTCETDIPEYTKEHMHDLIHFGVKHWFKMIDSHKYKSVLFFKNHGPLSGGTIRHPHMQIVGLKSMNDQLMFDPREFAGITIDKHAGVEFNISTYPRIGFSEFNVVPDNNDKLDQIADYIQIAVDYLMNHFTKRCKSYNLFFYLVDGLIRVKIMPRFATSPLFIGYNIHLRPNNLELIVNELQTIYFKK